MEESEEEEEAAELHWLRPEQHQHQQHHCGPRSWRDHGSGNSAVSTGNVQHRIIMHLDLDCFYAQVEMISNPGLRDQPVGVYQKCLLVTCNYKARDLGVKKCTFVREAKESCPDLVLVNGEDLTKYREISYKVTALLEEFTPLVERLGLDENFVDITEMVDLRLEQWKKSGFSKFSLCGHVFNNRTVDLHNPEHIRLAAGSQIASELREAVHERLGLTGSAGVASNKLLSKLVSGTFKPNQQTVLLPESQQDLMASLGCISKVPGIGPKTAKRIAMLGVVTVCDLQTCSAAILENELGATTAEHVQKLSRGEDDSPVTPSGPPQSLSDEDSFKICSSETEVKKKVEELLVKLLERLRKDGRKPYTIRLSIRQCCSTNKWLNRESRQCPIPSHLAQRIGTGDGNVKTHLVALLMKLFCKMINVKAYFHITLLSVCFSNLKAVPASPKHSIGFYLTRSSPSAGCRKIVCKMEDVNTENTTPASQVECCKSLAAQRSASVTPTPSQTVDVPSQTQILDFPPHSLPAGVDHDVFNQLPRDIKEEIISIQKTERNSAAAVLSCTLKGLEKVQDQVKCDPLDFASSHQNVKSPTFCDVPSTSEKPQLTPSSTTSKDTINVPCMDPAGPVNFKGISPVPSHPSFLQTCIPKGQKNQDQEGSSVEKNSAFLLPPTVDPQTFSELPTTMQKELLIEWKSQDLVSKIRARKAPDKLQKKKKGSLPSSPQSNSLLRYFKPN